jgi:hypothetical protein
MPMLTLLKQARAFGLGIVLATQNPVDLDYKGLSNAGTWFLGRLQTKRDKDRVLEGLEGASSAAGQSFDRQRMDELLSSLANRVFLMNNVHLDQPTVFQTRWILSYLRGPLTREQIQSLMAPRKQAQAPGDQASIPQADTSLDPGAASTIPSVPTGSAVSSASNRPVLPPDVPEFFIPPHERLDAGVKLVYRPALLGVARLHYTDKKADVDHWETIGLLSAMGEEIPADIWAGAKVHASGIPELDKSPEAGVSFAPLPGALARAKSYTDWSKGLKNHLYRDWKLTLWYCVDLKAYSQPRETQRDFRVRLAQGSRELRDQAIDNLRAKYASQRAKLQDEIRKARERLDREQAQASKAKWDAAIAFGNSVLGAVLGRKTVSKTNVGKVSNAAKAAGRAVQQHSETGSAEANLDRALEKFTDFELKVQAEVEQLEATRRPEALVVERIELAPKKADITIEQVVLAWTPWMASAGGQSEPAL